MSGMRGLAAEVQARRVEDVETGNEAKAGLRVERL